MFSVIILRIGIELSVLRDFCRIYSITICVSISYRYIFSVWYFKTILHNTWQKLAFCTMIAVLHLVLMKVFFVEDKFKGINRSCVTMSTSVLYMIIIIQIIATVSQWNRIIRDKSIQKAFSGFVIFVVSALGGIQIAHWFCLYIRISIN